MKQLRMTERWALDTGVSFYDDEGNEVTEDSEKNEKDLETIEEVEGKGR